MIVHPQIKYRHLLPLIILILLTSCDPKRVYENYLPTDKNLWNRYDIKKFDVQIKDTTIFYDFYINIRNTTDYPYSNMFIFFNTQFPDGQLFRDTLECQLADLQGRWLGKGIGKIKDNRIRFKSMVRFPRSGTYLFSVEQAMRVVDLQGITDIGLRIEKH